MSCLLVWDGKSSRILRHNLYLASEVASSFQCKQETDLRPPRARHINAHFFQSGLLLFGLLPFSMLIKAIDAVCISHHLCHTYQGLWYILTWCILEQKYMKVPTIRSTCTQEGKQIFNNVIQRTYNLDSWFCIIGMYFRVCRNWGLHFILWQVTYIGLQRSLFKLFFWTAKQQFQIELSKTVMVPLSGISWIVMSLYQSSSREPFY